MVAYLVGIELRRRWRGIALLALLVAIVVGTVLASVAGARRSRTAFDRYLAELNGPDVIAFGDPETLAGIGHLPFVEATASLEVAALSPISAPQGSFFPMVVSSEGLVPYEYLRMPVVEGRLADPSAPLEVTVGERTARRLDLDVHDRLRMQSWSGRDAGDVGDSAGDPEPDGPTFDLEVVGIVREPGDLGSRDTDISLTFLTPAFRERFDHDEIGDIGTGTFVVLDHPGDLSKLSTALARTDVELDASLSPDAMRRQIDPTFGAIATALYVFAGVVALAGLAAVAYTVSRMQAGAAPEDRTLSALGVGRPARWARLMSPGAVAVTGGAALGLGLTIGASPIFPVGLARRAEPHLGVGVDAGVLLGGGALALALGLALVLLLAALSARSINVARPGARSLLSARAASAGAPPAVVAGLTMATGAGRGGRSPVTTAVGGAALGVLGVIAAGMFAASSDHLLASPSLYGWGWDANIAGANTSHLADGALDADTVVADPDLAMVAILTQQLSASFDGMPAPAITAHDLKAHLRPVVVLGSAPTRADEVALGQATLDSLGKEVGDMVETDIGNGPRHLAVTGVVALPVTEDGGSSSTGAFLPHSAATALGFGGICEETDSCFRNLAVKLEPGAVISEVVARYEDADNEVAVDVPTPPAEIQRLTAVRNLPWFLAAFLALLAGVAVTHAAASGVRRHRRDLAILRVVGMSAAQVRGVVAVQVLVLAVGGAVVGTVGGIIAGRVIWRMVVRSLSLPFSPTLPMVVLLVVPVATLALTQLAATASRRAAGRTSTALTLRTE